MLDVEKRPPDIHGQHHVKARYAHFLDGLADVDSGIVHQDVELSRLGDHLLVRCGERVLEFLADEENVRAVDMAGQGDILLDQQVD